MLFFRPATTLFGSVSMPRNWMRNFRENLFQETSPLQRATDRIDPINSAQTTEIWWKDLILKTMRPQQSDGPQYTQVSECYRWKTM